MPPSLQLLHYKFFAWFVGYEKILFLYIYLYRSKLEIYLVTSLFGDIHDFQKGTWHNYQEDVFFLNILLYIKLLDQKTGIKDRKVNFDLDRWTRAKMLSAMAAVIFSVCFIYTKCSRKSRMWSWRRWPMWWVLYSALQEVVSRELS